MTGCTFTDSTRGVLIAARGEAARFGHPSVGPEHLLLGVLRCEDPYLLAAIRGVNLDPATLQHAILSRLPAREATSRSAPDLPYTARAKKVLEEAMAESRDLVHPYVGPEHLLLGIVRAGRNPAAEVLGEAGTDLTSLRAAVVSVASTDLGDEPRLRTPDVSPSLQFVPHAYTDTLFPAANAVAIGIAIVALFVAALALIVALRR